MLNVKLVTALVIKCELCNMDSVILSHTGSLMKRQVKHYYRALPLSVLSVVGGSDAVLHAL